MCGIAFLKRNDNHSPVKPLLARYNEQKHRGQQGFGFVAVKKGKVIGYERSTTFEEIEKKLQDFHNSDEILFHHRMPTSTKNLEETAHPIFVSNRILKHDYYLIHNGVITNPEMLKTEHEKLGFEYNTEVELFAGYKQKHRKSKKKQRVEVTKTEFNDSESLAIEFALFNEGIKPEIETRGSVAFICYEVTKDTHQVVAMHYGRNNNPIKAFRAHGMFVLSSESKDQGHVDVEEYKCITIPYENGVQGSGIVKPLRLDSSFSSSRSSGSSSSSQTSSSFEYNRLDSHTHKRTVGYDTNRYVNRGSLNDDFEETKPTVIMLPSKLNSCTHGNESWSMCGLCLISTTKESNVIEVTCGRTGDVVTKCYCKLHRKRTKELKRKQSKEPTQLELGIESPYMDSSGKKYCTVCDNRIAGAQYFSKELKDWVHYDCVPENKDDEQENDYTKRLNVNYTKIEDEIEQMENEIDELNDLIAECDTDGSRAEEWFNATMKLDETQKRLDTKKHDLNRLASFIDGTIF